MLLSFPSFSLVLAFLGRILSPSCRKMAPRWTKMAPRWPKIAPRLSKIAPRWPKIAQHSLQEEPQEPKILQKCCTLVVFSVFAIFGKIAPKIQKNRSPRCSPKKCAKLAILASKLANLGTSWRQVGQLGAILAHLGAKMRPNSHPNGAPDALQIASWAILAPRGSPRTSKVPLEPQFSTIFPRIMDRIRLIFQAAFFNFQPQVRHGGGLARAAHCIHPPAPGHGRDKT